MFTYQYPKRYALKTFLISSAGLCSVHLILFLILLQNWYYCQHNAFPCLIKCENTLQSSGKGLYNNQNSHFQHKHSVVPNFKNRIPLSFKENILNQTPADIPIGLTDFFLSVFCSELQLALSPEGRNAPLVPANYSSSPILVYCMALYTCELYEEFIKLHEQIYDKIHSNSLFTDTYNKDVDKVLKNSLLYL